MYVVVDGLELIASLDFSTSMYKCVWEVDMMDISKGGKNNTWILLLISEFYPVYTMYYFNYLPVPFLVGGIGHLCHTNTMPPVNKVSLYTG